MILLLDAHALLWWLAEDPQLATSARTAIADPATDVFVSAATIWEIEIKRAVGKLDAPDGLVQIIVETGFGILPITGEDAERAGRLAPHHRDPFDRMLVAQALVDGLAFATRDVAFRAYDVPLIAA